MTIKWRIILIVSIVSGIVLSGFAMLVYHQIERSNLRVLDSRLETLAQRLVSEIDEHMEEGRSIDREELDRIASRTLPGSRYVLRDTSGGWMFPDTVLLSRNSRALAGSRHHGKFASERFEGRWFRLHRVPMELLERRGWLLIAAAPLDDFDEMMERILWILVTSIPAALAVLALLVWWIVGKAFRPLTAMIETADRISDSTLHERVPVSGRSDEVTKLGTALNTMVGRLEQAFRRQRQFVADASHELRTPVTIVQSELEYANRSELPDEARQSIGIALDELERINTLTSRMLALAKLEHAGTEPVREQIRLDQIVVNAIERFAHAASAKGIQLRVHAGEPAEIMGDAEQMRSVVLNLLDNAVKYTPAGGVVEAGVECGRETVRLYIRDTGSGIAVEDRPHLFEPFYRSARSRAENNGSGLGLTIVKRIVELHVGTVSVESGNQGTTVVVQFACA